MSTTTEDRRAHPRRELEPGEPLARIRMRIGAELTGLDLSASGALVEGTARLAPGARVDVHLMTRHGRLLVRCRVARAFVSRVQADGVWFRGGLLFDHPVDPSAYGYSLPQLQGPAQPETGNCYP
jgi:hypothetical protein